MQHNPAAHSRLVHEAGSEEMEGMADDNGRHRRIERGDHRSSGIERDGGEGADHWDW